MALGSVSVSSQDNGNGDFTSAENQFLFIGLAGKNAGTVQYIDQTTDLDEVLGVNASKLKTTIQKARQNAGTNWTAIAMPVGTAGEWQTSFDSAMANNLVCEAVVVTDPVTTQEELDAMNVAVVNAENQYGRYLHWFAVTSVMDASTTWADFIASFDELQDGVAAPSLSLIPEVFSGWLGTYCGRLCHEDQSIADSPMRVVSGAIVGLSTLPVDKDGITFNMSHAKALNDARGTVPQVYADYDGIYCSDGMTLAPEASDFAVIENCRVVNVCKREVRILGIKKIADRGLNNTPTSVAAHEAYFMRPLINRSKSSFVGKNTVPGDVKPPQDGDVAITWKSRTNVEVGLLIRPYNSPKAIAATVALELSNEV
ncbi:DUF2586 domain-containing protein [Marinomonas aquiplantarum]|uniref:Uncharacterized protein DUF2586 n=1 Tax=Marinomonas aquiplantarum TaxID=491951 RepID=A0A366D037_9GAMM|nr:DUF2586 domain-containing protein [Marinomonas aquiplantarum]RBO83432.1 uncharacterized protein DUF2586 [Marinomonas aquiplantarum]